MTLTVEIVAKDQFKLLQITKYRWPTKVGHDTPFDEDKRLAIINCKLTNMAVDSKAGVLLVLCMWATIISWLRDDYHLEQGY